MNVTKIMTDLLKLVDKKKTQTCNYGVDKRYVYITFQGHSMFKIDRDLFLIDLEKALPDKRPLTNPGEMFNVNKVDLEDAIKSKEIRRFDKTTVVKLVSDNYQTWINERYLKEFDKRCSFKIGKKTNSTGFRD